MLSSPTSDATPTPLSPYERGEGVSSPVEVAGGPLPPVEEQIRQEVARERARLIREAGLPLAVGHYKRPVEGKFSRSQRQHTTILIGGLTERHNELILAGLRGLGYQVHRLPTPTKADFQAGKEYGNNGQCNPAYFTVGSLVNYLKELRDRRGLPTERILQEFVFVTAGACGPCRFGMYEAEFRLALRNSGFDGFRVLLFDQCGGADQAAADAGIEFNLPFFLVVLNALFMGDILNEVGYRLRPYEVVPGSTNAALAECLHLCQQALQNKDFRAIKVGWPYRWLTRVLPLASPHNLALLVDQLCSDTLTGAMDKCRDILNARVEVDYTRTRPLVKTTGEFWAQTTEGDGNFRMFSFLEGEGAQVCIEPATNWLCYTLQSVMVQLQNRRGLEENEVPPSCWDLLGRCRVGRRYYGQLGRLGLARAILCREYERLRRPLREVTHPLINLHHLQRLAHAYYDHRVEGGEGNLEVAKNIYSANHGLAHMVLSLKPFGCLPSSQSDGVQAAVVNHFPDMIFLPIETSGEGDINAYSRVQMALGEAKMKCKKEFVAALGRSGYSLAQIQAQVAAHRELRQPVQCIRHQRGVVGQAANFVLHVADRLNRTR